MVKITGIRIFPIDFILFCPRWILSGLLCFIGFFRKLSTVPDSHDPDRFFFYTIKETVWAYNHFTKRKIGKLWQCPAGLRELS